MTHFLREFLLAVQFFTRIPVTGRLAEWVGYSPDMLRASAAHFPGVGIVVGTGAAAAYALLILVLPDSPFSPLVAAVLSTAFTALLTGGFHEDGLADVTDGLGGSHDREHALEIMKDSRVGAFGAMALVLALLAKVSLLALLGSMEFADVAAAADVEAGLEDAATVAAAVGTPFTGWPVCAALFAGHVVSRGLPLLLIRWLPHVGQAGRSKSKPLADEISRGSLLVAFVWCMAALLLASTVIELSSLVVASSFAAIALLWMARIFKRRLRGFTGDCLGATQQVCEIAFYLGLAVSWA
ncbi:MAG: adenosylcobinamide-GDP ribazoletransferase [Comamonadaceae bacterium]|nr:MAG: adenosylcobinamide-GDP ribazoletransferase [Comamonadaceae bacterium]